MQVQKRRKTHTRVPLLGKLLLLLPATCVIFYPLWLAGQLNLETKTIWSDKLPAVFDGLKIAYVSDIHAGAYFSQERLNRLIDKINALNADIVVLGGDYGQTSEDALHFFNALPVFKAKLCVIGIVGNHDRTVPDSRLNDLIIAMRAANVTPLINDAILLKKNGKTLALCGLDDYYNGFPDVELVRRKTQNADYTIFLPHTPDFLPEIKNWFFDLALCGHTHGGQVTLFGHALKSSSCYGDRYLSGWKRENGADILISNGVGTSFLPVRIGAPPQYHLITLRSGSNPAQ